jgi:hypothetical protein
MIDETEEAGERGREGDPRIAVAAGGDDDWDLGPGRRA